MFLPILLEGESLDKRHRELNLKVAVAASNNLSLEQVKEETEKSDVDRIFKIDLAAKYKDVDYIIETLKCGDGLYITRALKKCTWLFDGQYNAYINPNYLRDNIFPFMSNSMQRKLLNTISTNMRDEKTAEHFYKYCFNANLRHHAIKFLIFTSFDFKANLIKNKDQVLSTVAQNNSDIISFLNNDFTLVERYLEMIFEQSIIFKRSRCQQITLLLRDFYHVDPERYLNLLECNKDEESYIKHKGLGKRITRDIVKKHKVRVLNNATFYFKLLTRDRDIFGRYTTLEEAKQYAVAVLPADVNSFWAMNYYREYQFILDLIPSKERYHFIKMIFKEKYPLEEFEMTISFYNCEYYNLMSVEEREAWAISHLENGSSILSTGNDDFDYLWYRFVNYDAAVVGIKKYILKTPEADKRSSIVHVLVESARNQFDLEKLFNFYYERFVNEARRLILKFLYRVLKHHNIFKVNETSWISFQKILYSIEVFNLKELPSYENEDFLQLALLYYVIHDMKFVEPLTEYTKRVNIAWPTLKVHMDKITEKKEKVYDFILDLNIKKLENIELKMNDKNEIEARRQKAESYKKNDLSRGADGKTIDPRTKEYYELWPDERRAALVFVEFIIKLQKYFGKPEESLPDIVIRFMKLDYDRFYPSKKETLNQNHLLRLLKKDASLLVSKISHINNNKVDTVFKANVLLKKLKIYFSNDFAKKFLEFYERWIAIAAETDIYLDCRSMFRLMFGVFQLANETIKSEIMKKYAPTCPKINHSEINRKHLLIQQAICRVACYSRPPVPHSDMFQYITGDYVHYCLPIFNRYLETLTPGSRLEFVASLLDKPLSIQKQGLRMAFKCFSVADLKTLIWKAWRKSKNISLRMVIYTYLFNDILQRKDDEIRSDLFKILLELTLQINDEDHKDVITILTRNQGLSLDYKGPYLENAWKVISGFKVNGKNLDRMIAVLNNIREYIHCVDKVFVRTIVDDYLNAMFTNQEIIPDEKKEQFRDINKTKFSLTYTLVVKYTENNTESGLEIVKLVIGKCLDMWDCKYHNIKKNSDYYYCRRYCFSFIDEIIGQNYILKNKNYNAINPILKLIEEKLLESLPLHQVYIVIWDLRFAQIVNCLADDYMKNKQDDYQLNTNLASEVLKRYTAKVADLVMESVENKTFCVYLFNEIAAVISTNLKDRLGYILKNMKLELLIIVGAELVKTKRSQLVILALNLLSGVADKKSIAYKEIVKAIEVMDDFDVQAEFYQKISRNKFHKEF